MTVISITQPCHMCTRIESRGTCNEVDKFTDSDLAVVGIVDHLATHKQVLSLFERAIDRDAIHGQQDALNFGPSMGYELALNQLGLGLDGL